jgi:hypothetical protein
VRVPDVEAPVARERVTLAPVDVTTGGRDRARDRVEILDDERRMGLAGGDERVLHADVELCADRAPHVVRPEPGAAASTQVLGLLDLGEAQAVGVEAPTGVLAARRTGDLDVVEGDHATLATAKTRRNGSTTRPSRSG